MKKAVALFACCLLVLGQLLAGAPAALGAAAQADQPCRHCDCGGRGCCVSETPTHPASPASPAAPAPGHSEELGAAMLLAERTPAPRRFVQDSPPVPVLARFKPALPLHARLCCFLI